MDVKYNSRMSYSILIVDDEDVIREGLKQVVAWEKLGYSVVGTVSSGEDALRFLEDHAVDVLLTDIRMPRISGIELARLVKANYPETSVVIISGYDNFSYAQNAIRYGVYHYLLKPCAEEEILEVFGRLYGEIARTKERKLSSRKLDKLLVQEELANMVAGKIPIEEARALLSWINRSSTGSLRVVLLQLLPDDEFFASALNEQNYAQIIIDQPLYESFDKQLDTGDSLVLKLPLERFLVISVTDENGDSFSVDSWFNQVRTNLHDNMPLAVMGIHTKYSDEGMSLDKLLHALLRYVPHLLWENKLGMLKWIPIKQFEGPLSNPPLLPDPGLLAKVMCSSKNDEIDTNTMGLFESIERVEFSTAIAWLQAYLKSLREIVEPSGTDFSPVEMLGEHLMGFVECCATEKRMRQIATRLGEVACHAVLSHKNRCYSKNIRDALQMIDKRYQNNLNLDEVSRELGLTSTYMSKLFKREVGINYKEYVLEKQMSEAKRLLRETNDKIYEVAEAVGFGDQHYFSDVFKRSTTLTPLEYRKVRTDG